MNQSRALTRVYAVLVVLAPLALTAVGSSAVMGTIPAKTARGYVHSAATDILYRDVVHDRSDRFPTAPMAGWADIRRTSRTVIRADDHRRIRVTGSARAGTSRFRGGSRRVFFVTVDLDTHGGPSADYHFDWRPFGESGICDFDEGIDASIDRCRLRYTDSGALSMSGRLENLKVTKSIRFRAYTYAGPTAEEARTLDKAPNRGWRS